MVIPNEPPKASALDGMNLKYAATGANVELTWRNTPIWGMADKVLMTQQAKGTLAMGTKLFTVLVGVGLVGQQCLEHYFCGCEERRLAELKRVLAIKSKKLENYKNYERNLLNQNTISSSTTSSEGSWFRGIYHLFGY